jgi:hypothetical protein
MKHYYIVPYATWASGMIDLFGAGGSHWIRTDDPSKILVACDFGDEVNRSHWENQNGVEALPHPLDSSPVDPRHIGVLKGIGAVAGDRTRDITRKAAGIHP